MSEANHEWFKEKHEYQHVMLTIIGINEPDGKIYTAIDDQGGIWYMQQIATRVDTKETLGL